MVLLLVIGDCCWARPIAIVVDIEGKAFVSIIGVGDIVDPDGWPVMQLQATLLLVETVLMTQAALTLLLLLTSVSIDPGSGDGKLFMKSKQCN